MDEDDKVGERTSTYGSPAVQSDAMPTHSEAVPSSPATHNSYRTSTYGNPASLHSGMPTPTVVPGQTQPSPSVPASPTVDKSQVIGADRNGQKAATGAIQADGIYRCDLGHGTAHIGNPDDVPLFEEILKDSRSGTKIDQALVKFSGRKNGDALVKLVYGVTFYDMILKYSLDKSKDAEVQPRKDFEKQLLLTGVYFEEEPSLNNKEVYIKVIVPFDRMCKEAETMKLRFTIKEPEVVPGAETSLLGNAMSLLFTLSGTGTKSRAPSAFFRADHLQNFVGFDQNIKPLHEIQRDAFTTRHRILIADHIISRIKVVGAKSKALNVRNMLRRGIFTEYYALHDGTYKPDAKNTNMRAQLTRNWVNKWYAKQPLNDIRDYFGEKIAFYYGWLGYYTMFLVAASIIGWIVFFYGIKQMNSPDNTIGWAALFDNDLTMFYAFFLSIWATVFLEFWKRRSNVLAYRWDMSQYEKEEKTRPEWVARRARKSPVTGKYERYDSQRIKLGKRAVGLAVVGVCILIVILAVGAIIVGRVAAKNVAGVNVIFPLISLAVILLLAFLYKGIALKLTKWENHKTETEFENALIAKQFLFDFVNSYSSLFYLGIVKDNMSGTGIFNNPEWQDKCDGSCMAELMVQLAIIFVGKQVIGQVVEVVIPYLTRFKEERKEKAQRDVNHELYAQRLNAGGANKTAKEVNIPRWMKDDLLVKFESLTAEYNEMALQFGFVTLFGPSFPLGPFFALLNNVVEIRTDAMKMLQEMQRPVPFRAQNIGTWSEIFTSISFFAVLTNAFLIAFGSTHFNTVILAGVENKLIGRLAFVMAFEHLVYSFKFVLAYVIPDVPLVVQESQERENYLASLSIDGEAPAEDDPEALQILGITVTEKSPV